MINTVDPTSFFVPLVLAQSDERLRRVPPFSRADQGLAIYSAIQSLRFTTDFYGTLRCAPHTDVREHGSRTR
jgi:hypothetical protein